MDLSSKLSLTYGSNINYYKSVHHPILIRGNMKKSWKFSKQISQLFFQ